MDRILTTRLRADALALRRLASSPTVSRSELTTKREAMLRDVHRILTLTLGPPPSPVAPFAWEFYDADGTFRSLKITPQALAAELSSSASVAANNGVRVHALFSLVHDPRNAYHTLLSVSRLGNVVEGRPITYVNVPIPTMKAACVKMLRAGMPVFFGSDVGQYLDIKHGVLDPALVDYEVAFGVEVGSARAMSKAERLGAHESAMTHAMVLTGVHLEPATDATGGGEVEETTVRWRVENSWGVDSGDKGYLVMADAWFDEFVYQAVVDPRFVSKEVSDVLDAEPKVLPLWDPMGALA